MRGYYRKEDEIEKPKPTAAAPPDATANWHRRGDTERRHHVSREPSAASEEHITIGDCHEIHVFKDGEGEDWVVWLNTGTSDFDGLVLGTGASRQEAITVAVMVAEAIERALQGPPA